MSLREVRACARPDEEARTRAQHGGAGLGGVLLQAFERAEVAPLRELGQVVAQVYGVAQLLVSLRGGKMHRWPAGLAILSDVAIGNFMTHASRPRRRADRVR